MKKLISLITMSLSIGTLLYSQNFNFEQGQQTTGNRGADTIVRYLMTNLGAGSVGFAGRNPTDTFYLYSDGDSTYWTADKNLVLKPQNGGGIVRIDGQIKISGGNPSNGYILTTDANGLCTFAPPPSIPTQFSVTHAQADSLSSAGALVSHAWYNITDEAVYLLAASDTAFELDGYYADSTIWEVDAIQYDFPNQHIQQRCDRRGNCVGSTFSVLTLMGVNPVDVFIWGNNNVLGNTVKDAVLYLDGNPDPSVAGNIVLFFSTVTVLTQEDIFNNTFSNTVADFNDTATVSSGVFQSSTLLVSGTAMMDNAYTNNSSVTLSGDVTAGDIQVYKSTIVAENSAEITSALLREQSILIVSDTVIASGIELWEGDTVILSGTVNAINVRCYSGADIEASGSAFIEGMVIQNVSKFYGSGSGSLSPSFICNQSTVTISGNVDMGNNHISSSVVDFTDSVRCQNCWFYSVNDTFDGITLDTFNYTINNRSTFNKTLDVDTFYLTDGTQGVGKVLTDVTGNGKGTWQDPTAYGEMGFGDSTRTIALTQNVFSVVTNTAKNLLSAEATTLHNVTYQGDSLKVDSAGTYQIIINLSVDGTNTSVLELGVFKNGVLMAVGTGHIELVNNHTVQISYNDIAPLAVGDGLRIVIINTANNDDVTARNGKITINKLR